MTLCISSVALALLAVVPPLDKLHYGCNMTGHSVSVSTEFFFFSSVFLYRKLWTCSQEKLSS